VFSAGWVALVDRPLRQQRHQRPLTTTTRAAVEMFPAVYVEATVTLYRPGRLYWWLTVAPCAVAPSPNAQRVRGRGVQTSRGATWKRIPEPTLPRLGTRSSRRTGPTASYPTTSRWSLKGFSSSQHSVVTTPFPYGSIAASSIDTGCVAITCVRHRLPGRRIAAMGVRSSQRTMSAPDALEASAAPCTCEVSMTSGN
jgi:hypothetical protein